MSKAADDLSARGRSIRQSLGFLIFTLVTGAIALCAWHVGAQPPSLDAALELLHRGKPEEAAAKLKTILLANPDFIAAKVLLAQVLLKGAEAPDAASSRPRSADEALTLLDQVRPTSSNMAVTALLCRGDALDILSRLDEAEEAWLQAIDADPTAPQAGFNLLNLYYVQGREEDARRLGLRLFETEPDAHDRALLLLELIRPDARPPAAAAAVKFFEPIVEKHPGELHSAIALGLALVRTGQVERGIEVLRQTAQAHAAQVEPWDALLVALDESGQVDVMEEELKRVPTDAAESGKLLKHQARIAQGTRWKEAVDLYRKARLAEPYNRVVEYRLSRALRHVGQIAEADQIQERLRRRDVAIQEIRPLYDQATDVPDLRVSSNPELCQQIAATRERMQLAREAIAWHRLVLENQPENTVSLEAADRLKKQDTR
jgi:tetratricopeptide (TPR) repeat protein